MSMNAQSLTRLMKGRWLGRYGMVKCPAHADRTPSCRVKDGDDGPLFHCFAGCDWRDVRAAFEDQGYIPKWEPNRKGQTTNQPVTQTTKPEEPPITRMHPDVVKKRNWAASIWNDCQPVSGTLGEDYLRDTRAISTPLPDCVRFHPNLKHSASGKKWPAIVFAYSSFNGDFDGVQRIFIDPSNADKAPIEFPKLSLGTFPGGAIRLQEIIRPSDDWPYYGELGLCEGPEDGLSTIEMYDVATWSTGAGEKMAMVELPSPIEQLWIYADNGNAGRKYADKTQVAHYMKVRQKDGIPMIGKVFPQPQYDDFNEVLKAQMCIEQER